MPDNPYIRWLNEDNNQCLPVADRGELQAIMQETMFRVVSAMGPGPTPSFGLDLEHLQVTDYSTLGGVSSVQQQFIAKLHAAEPIRPEEILFLGLRSLFQTTWPPPTNDHDLRFAAAFDFTLGRILAGKALNFVEKFKRPTALLPYWGRLSFLRIMCALPEESIARYALDKVACTLVKRAKFNATTFALEHGAMIGANYALEPILKHLNRYLLHFSWSREMAGPMRMSRAWNSIAPTVTFFWSDVAATTVTRPSIMLYEDMGVHAHRLTANQIDFILMHELGHVALDHPTRLKEEIRAGNSERFVRHEFEYAADAFALGLLRSKLMKESRIATEAPDRTSDERTARVTTALRDYQTALGAVYLLFAYMDFIQRAGDLLRERLAGRMQVREQMDSHPRASVRLDRLELTNLGEHLYTSPIERYSRKFLQDVLDHAAGLDDETLLESVTQRIAA